MRVFFIYEDPFDDAEVNLSFVDVPTQDQQKAFKRIEEAAGSGELWRAMYPDDRDRPYKLIKNKMACIDISALPHEPTVDTILPL